MSAITPVILCGGSGTRLWPRSRKARPKPFLPLLGERTMFEETLLRCADSERFEPAVVVTGAAHLEHVESQLCGLPGARIIVEPEAKNTAAAIALAAMRLPEDAVMLVCPSDHHIADCDAFVSAAGSAAALAADGWLVSFGFEARHPETGFGYLRQGEPVGSDGFRVAQFIEKPDRVRAERFLAEGGYAWNGGIFAFRAGTFLEELRRHRPAMANAVARALAGGREDGSRFHPEPAAFAEIESESVDYAVMENTARAAMVPAAMGWSDIGNWQALHEAIERDEHGNAVRGQVQLVDCRNVLVDSDGPRVSAIGLEDVIIVVDGDEVLVTTADGAQLVGKLDGAAGR
jgi:mannose-1-phosphate guanylyltransferase/mannose-1-phosphate guanylyltransferase/mannose-6-phosphate isomerase